MEEVTRVIQHWMAKNNIEREGVRLILEFPSREALYRAEMTIKREIEPLLAYRATGVGFGKIETMNELALTLRFNEGLPSR